MHSPKISQNKNIRIVDNVNVNVSKGVRASDSFVTVRTMSYDGKTELYFATNIILVDI